MTTSTIPNFQIGIEEAKRGNTFLGIQLLNNPEASTYSPEVKAWHGYCLATEYKQIVAGLSMCKEALQIKPNSSDIFLALGRIYLIAGHRKSAIQSLERGFRLDNNKEIGWLLNSIGVRKLPAIRLLDRNNRVNIVIGRLLTNLGFR